jgi:hypothetical protein
VIARLSPSQARMATHWLAARPVLRPTLVSSDADVAPINEALDALRDAIGTLGEHSDAAVELQDAQAAILANLLPEPLGPVPMALWRGGWRDMWAPSVAEGSGAHS